MKKRVNILLLCLLLISLSALLFVGFERETSAAVTILAGAGSEQDPFRIESEDDLWLMKSMVEGQFPTRSYRVQSATEFTVENFSIEKFYGTFDANGSTIRTSSTAPIFPDLYLGSTISNLNIEYTDGAIITPIQQWAEGIPGTTGTKSKQNWGAITNSGGGIIENCTVNLGKATVNILADSRYTSDYFIGGVVGEFLGSRLSNITLKGTLTVQLVQSASANAAPINLFMGGITGANCTTEANTVVKFENTLYKNCVNAADIRISGEGKLGDVMLNLGGISGFNLPLDLDSKSAFSADFESCANTGDLTIVSISNAEKFYSHIAIGGILPRAYYGENFRYCINTGSLNYVNAASTRDGSPTLFVGGIVGVCDDEPYLTRLRFTSAQTYVDKQFYGNISQAINTANSYGIGSSTAVSKSHVGGITSTFVTDGNATMTDVINYGRPYGNFRLTYSAGIAGLVSMTVPNQDAKLRPVKRLANYGTYGNGLIHASEGGLFTVEESCSLGHYVAPSGVNLKFYNTFSDRRNGASTISGVTNVESIQFPELFQTGWTGYPGFFDDGRLNEALCQIPSTFDMENLPKDMSESVSAAFDFERKYYPVRLFSQAGGTAADDPVVIQTQQDFLKLDLVRPDTKKFYVALGKDISIVREKPIASQGLVLDGRGFAINVSMPNYELNNTINYDLFSSAINCTFRNMSVIGQSSNSYSGNLQSVGSFVGNAHGTEFENLIIDYDIVRTIVSPRSGAIARTMEGGSANGVFVLHSIRKTAESPSFALPAGQTCTNVYLSSLEKPSVEDEQAGMRHVVLLNGASVKAAFSDGKILITVTHEVQGYHIKLMDSQDQVMFGGELQFYLEETAQVSGNLFLRKTNAITTEEETYYAYDGMMLKLSMPELRYGEYFAGWYLQDGDVETLLSRELNLNELFTLRAGDVLLSTRFESITAYEDRIYDGESSLLDIPHYLVENDQLILDADTYNYVVTIKNEAGEVCGTLSSSVTIAPRPLEITASGKLTREYDASVTSSVSYAIAEGSLVAGDTLSGTLGIENGRAKDVGNYTVVLHTLAHKNYVLLLQQSVYTITPRILMGFQWSVSGANSYDKTERTVTVTDWRVIEGEDAMFTFSITNGGVETAVRAAGTYTLTLTGQNNPNYLAKLNVSAAQHTYVMQKRTVTGLTFPNVEREYNATDVTCTVLDEDGKPFVDDEIKMTYTLDGAPFYGVRNAGRYTVIVKFETLSDNYNPMTYMSNQINILPKAVYVAFSEGEKIAYTGKEIRLNATVVGASAGDSLEVRLVYSSGKPYVVDPGTYTATAVEVLQGGVKSRNYELRNTNITQEFTVDRAQMSVISISAKSLTYMDNKLSDLVVDATFVGVDRRTLSVNMRIIGDSFKLTAGTHQVAVEWSVKGDFALYYHPFVENVTFQVLKKKIQITPDAVSGFYGEQPKGLTFVSDYAVEAVGDSFTGELEVLFDKDRPTVGAYAIGAGTLSAGSNYELTILPGGYYTILPRPVEISFTNYSNLTYNGDELSLGIMFYGVLAEDAVSAELVYHMQGQEEPCNLINAGRYFVTAVGLDNENYVLTGETTMFFSVARAVLSGFAFEDMSTVYDGNRHYLEVAGLPEYVQVTYNGNGVKNVGVYTVIAQFASNVNYEPIPSLRATVTITPYILTEFDISALEGLRYTGSEISIRLPAHGVAVGDRVYASVQPDRTVKDVGTYTLRIKGTDNHNYKVAEEQVCDCTVLPKKVSLVLKKPYIKIFDGTEATTLSLDDFSVNGLSEDVGFSAAPRFRLASLTVAQKILLVADDLALTGDRAFNYEIVFEDNFADIVLNHLSDGTHSIDAKDFTLPADAKFEAKEADKTLYEDAISGLGLGYQILAAYEMDLSVNINGAIRVRLNLFGGSLPADIYAQTDKGLVRVQYTIEDGYAVFDSAPGATVILVRKSAMRTYVVAGAILVGALLVGIVIMTAIKARARRRRDVQEDGTN